MHKSRSNLLTVNPLCSPEKGFERWPPIPDIESSINLLEIQSPSTAALLSIYFIPAARKKVKMSRSIHCTIHPNRSVIYRFRSSVSPMALASTNDLPCFLSGFLKVDPATKGFRNPIQRLVLSRIRLEAASSMQRLS